MTDLIKRLEEAEAGSRELDALIWAHFRPEKIKVTGWGKPYADESGRTQVEFHLPPKRTRTVTGGKSGMPHAEPVTTSLDAALALAEQLGLSVSQLLNDALEGPSGEGIWATGGNPDKPHAPQIAKFVCIAILKATDTGREG
jgi:hypothetical protein